ncbi:hypothetical protein ACUXV3_16320 [Roseobacteraceae bacterium NS-SX3]
MTFDLVLMGTALHLLIWEKLPEWGTWFNRLLVWLPRPLQRLYDQWHCPYCAGFWIALALHAATGIWTLPALAEMPEYLGRAAAPAGWFLDALASATLIYAAVIALRAIGLPAMKAQMMRQVFMNAAFGQDAQASGS